MKYRKKPVEIEAVRVNLIVNGEAYSLSWGEPRPEWLADAMDATMPKIVSVGAGQQCHKLCVLIRTLEGVMEAQNGDFIIRGVSGELYPCKPDIFEKTYEKVG